MDLIFPSGDLVPRTIRESPILQIVILSSLIIAIVKVVPVSEKVENEFHQAYIDLK